MESFTTKSINKEQQLINLMKRKRIKKIRRMLKKRKKMKRKMRKNLLL